MGELNGRGGGGVQVRRIKNVSTDWELRKEKERQKPPLGKGGRAIRLGKTLIVSFSKAV